MIRGRAGLALGTVDNRLGFPIKPVLTRLYVDVVSVGITPGFEIGRSQRRGEGVLCNTHGILHRFYAMCFYKFSL